MAKTRHNKHCTFKNTEVCICANLEAALKEQAEKYEGELKIARWETHRGAVRAYRSDLIDAFTNLIDGKFETVHECTPGCTDRYY